MNLNLQANACDRARVELFLSGDLTSAQLREFTLHLDTCENCRRSLHEQAAEPEAWIEAEKLLKPSEFDSFNADDVFGSAFVERSARQPIQIRNVIDALAPTDDPAMLGRLGGYEISGVVGAGGMGVVLKAIDKSLDRTVAIKVLAPHLAASGAARKRFAREAKAAAAVLHPNVIAIHSVSNDEALPYLVMPYLRGTTLQKRLDEEGPLSLHEILRIGSQIAAGLAAAHAQGLVHRDIKPANILLEQGVERVAITDFGLARAVDDATITHSGVIAGTPQYMSPEQARGEPVDGRSDLFSLGSVLYSICTGRPPFRAETTHGVMRRITDDEPAPIRDINPDIPDWLCSIIAKLMAKRAADRFDSAAEVTQLLEACLAHVQQPAAVPLPEQLRNHQSSTRAKRSRWSIRRLIAGAVFALAFVLAGVVIVLELNKGTLTIESVADDVSLRITQGDTVVEKLTVTQAGKQVRIAAGTYVVEIDGEAEGITVQDGKVTIQRGRTEIVRVVRNDVDNSRIPPAVPPEIPPPPDYLPAPRGGYSTNAQTKAIDVRKVAQRIEAMKSKFPPLKNFSADQHLRKNDIKNGFAPGTTSNPERYSITYHNGVEAAEVPKTGPRKSPTFTYDPETGIQLDIHFFEGDSRGADQTPPYRIGDLSVHVYVKGPAAEPIRGEIIRILQELGSDRPPARATEAPTAPPLPAHPPRNSADGDPNRDPEKPFSPSVPDPLPGSGERPVNASGFSETKELVLSMGSSKFMLDLDTGNTMDPPATVGRPEQAQMDVHTDQVQPYHYPKELIGVALQGLEVKASDWNASAADVRRALAGDAVGPLKQMDLGPEKNPTYFFKTRDGTHGILQLLEIVEEPKGIRLRYKTVQVGPKAHSADLQTKETTSMPKRTYHLPAGDTVKTIAVAPDGSLIAFANGTPTLILQTSGTSVVKDNWKPSVKIVEGEPHFGERGVASLKLMTDEEDAVLANTPRVSHFEVTALAFCPDASLLAVGTSIGQVKLFDTKTTELVRVLDDEQARRADKETPENWKSLKRALGSVASMAFSPDGSLLAVCGSSFGDYSDIFDGVNRLGRTGTGPGRLKIFEVKTGTLMHDLVGHSHAYDVAFSPEGDLFASAGSWAGDDNGTGVITWNTQSGKKVSTILNQANAGTHVVAFSPTRKKIAIGAQHYDKENGTYSTAISVAYPMSGITDWQQTISGHAFPKDFSPDGRNVAVLCGGESIRFIDIETGQVKHEIKPADSANGGRWTDFAIALKGQQMVIGRTDGERKGGVEIWEFNGPAAADE